MQYRRLGGSGLRVSAVSIGGWLTFGQKIDEDATRAVVRCAVEHGVNLIDVADSYAAGASERAVGAAAAGLRRADLVLSSKVYWPTGEGPNDRGLSRKHIMESIDRTLANLRTDYLDLYFCHREDPDCPLDETVRAMEDLVRSGKVLYWGTSNWGHRTIRRACRVARRTGGAGPIAEQPRYNLIDRGIERWLVPTTTRLGMGLVVWSPLAGGLLAGSHARQSTWQLGPEEAAAHAGRVLRFAQIARDAACEPAQLAIAWLLRRPFVSSVITGVSSTEHLLQNVRAAGITMSDAVAADVSRLFRAPAMGLGDLARLAQLAFHPRTLRGLLSAG